MASFASPWVMFLGSLWSKEQDYLRHLLGLLRPRGYTRLVEPAAGSFAVSLIARELGFAPSDIEASDVSLYSSALGGAVMGTDLEDLDVKVDGEPLALTGSPIERAARVLYTQLVLRNEAAQERKPNDYRSELIADLRERERDHLSAIAQRVENLAAALGPIRYAGRDLAEHTVEAASVPGTVVVVNAPTYKAGYEKFFDTGGRLTWAEPEFACFDPETSTLPLMEAADDLPGLLICLEDTEPGTTVRPPVYARQAETSRYRYYLSNRPEEVLEVTGGPVVATRQRRGYVASDLPMLPPDREVAPDSSIAVVPITADEAGYYKELWAHRLNSSKAQWNLALVLDGYLAGVFGINLGDVLRGDQIWPGHIFHIYGFCPDHDTYRLPRLVTMLAGQRPTLDLLSSPSTTLRFDAITHSLTVVMGPHPEAKHMRGIGKLVKKAKDPEHGWRLFYSTPIGEMSPEETLQEWLRKEAAWRAARAK